MSETYTCSVCGKTYEKPEGYDEVALANMKERYGDLAEGERAIVCDICWKKAEPILKETGFDRKINDEVLRLLQVIKDMRERGFKVVGLIGAKKDADGEELELVWGTADDNVTDELERRLVECIQNPDAVGKGAVRGRATVDPKEGLSWEKEPWNKLN
jgi:hypothetical protein